MDGPEPSGVRLLAEHRLDLRRLKGCAPVDGERPRAQSESARVVYQAVAEFSVRQDQAGFRMHRQLRSHHVVGQCAGAEENLDIDCASELAQAPFGVHEEIAEGGRSMGDRRLMHGVADLVVNGDGAWKKIERCGHDGSLRSMVLRVMYIG